MPTAKQSLAQQMDVGKMRLHSNKAGCSDMVTDADESLSMLLPTLEWLVALLMLETLSEECCLRMRRSADWAGPFPRDQGRLSSGLFSVLNETKLVKIVYELFRNCKTQECMDTCRGRKGFGNDKVTRETTRGVRVPENTVSDELSPFSSLTKTERVAAVLHIWEHYLKLLAAVHSAALLGTQVLPTKQESKFDARVSDQRKKRAYLNIMNLKTRYLRKEMKNSGAEQRGMAAPPAELHGDMELFRKRLSVYGSYCPSALERLWVLSMVGLDKLIWVTVMESNSIAQPGVRWPDLGSPQPPLSGFKRFFHLSPLSSWDYRFKAKLRGCPTSKQRSCAFCCPGALSAPTRLLRERDTRFSAPLTLARPLNATSNDFKRQHCLLCLAKSSLPHKSKEMGTQNTTVCKT
ncbi:hypothetical protein AAY473_002519 [Plecturocebus cupreus]